MNYTKFRTTLKSQTSSLPYQQQLKFAVLICQKLYFDYQKFTEVYNWGDANLIMDGILICTAVIEGKAVMQEVKAIMPKIEKVTPDMDDFNGDEIASYALNASAAVYETLEFIIDRDNTHIYNIGNYYTDTIDFRIQEERTLSEKEIEGHPLMIEAWNFIIEKTKGEV